MNNKASLLHISCKHAVTGVTVATLLFAAPAMQVLAQTTTPVVQSNGVSSTPDQLQLTAIPPRLGEDFSLKAFPGQTIQTTVRVKNSSQTPQIIKTAAEDFIIGEDGKQPIPVKEETTTQWSLAKWMTITPPIHILQPNQSATLNVLIEVPQDALPGGRYAMIMHQPSTDNTLGGGSTSGVSTKVGTLVYFVVEGDVHEEAYVRNVKVQPFFEHGPIPLSFEIENRSDIHIRPNVQIEIKNMLGMKSTLLTVDSLNIFPTTVKKYDVSWQKKWGFGRYSGTITANYGNQGNIATEVFSFWIIPLRLILGSLFAIASFVAIVIFIKKKILKSSTQKNKEIEVLQEKVKALESEKVKKFKDENN